MKRWVASRWWALWFAIQEFGSRCTAKEELNMMRTIIWVMQNEMERKPK